MTFNLGDGLAGPTELITALQHSGADIIGLQEVTQVSAAAVEAALANMYPYRVVRG